MIARRQLAARRKALGFSQEDLAVEIGVNPSTVVRWELGRSSPRARHRTLLATTLELSAEQLDQLIEDHPGGAGPQVSSHEVPFWLTHYASLEHGAGRIDTVQPILIPGLLQTRSYFTAMLRSYHFESLPEREVLDRVSGRLARQRVFDRQPHPPDYRCVIDESALYRVMGTADVMIEQLDHLVAMAERPTVEIAILPASSGALAANPGAFTLFYSPGAEVPFLAVTDVADGIHYSDGRDSIGLHVRLIEFLWEQALSPARSIGAILTARGALT